MAVHVMYVSGIFVCLTSLLAYLCFFFPPLLTLLSNRETIYTYN